MTAESRHPVILPPFTEDESSPELEHLRPPKLPQIEEITPEEFADKMFVYEPNPELQEKVKKQTTETVKPRKHTALLQRSRMFHDLVISLPLVKGNS